MQKPSLAPPIVSKLRVHAMPQTQSSRQMHKEFCKSVLRVEVPLVVTLASKKVSVDQVVNFVPGMIIQFEKPCSSPMDVEVENQPIADGEVVKIGDKFGIRIGQIAPVDERFVTVDEPSKQRS